MRKHGPSYRRGWKKIHIGMCAETQQIIVASLSEKEVADSQVLPDLLDAVQDEVEEVIADGAYDCRGCYEAIRKHGARAIIPPRKGARLSAGEPVMECRDQAIYRIRNQKRGKRRWKKEVDYHRRSLVETAMHRLKAHMGSNIRARKQENQVVEMGVKIFVLNEMMAMR